MVNKVVTQPTKGTLTQAANGAFVYTPNAGFSGVDTYTYTNKDASGQISGVVTVSITVRPVATNDAYTTNTNVTLNTAAATGILANDKGSGLVTDSIVANPANGTLTQNADGSFSYVPNAGFSGIDTYTYTLRDSSGQVSNVATVTVTVKPVATGDTYQAIAGQPLTIGTGTGVLTNDVGSTVTVNQVVAQPTKGTLTQAADGSFVYTPNANFSGTDSYTYNVKDAIGQVSNTVTVTIAVKPSAIDDAYTLNSGTALTTTVASSRCVRPVWPRSPAGGW